MAPGKQNGKQALSPLEKLNAIRMVSAGQSKASVARELQIPESTLRGWCKNEDKIESQVTGRPAKTKSPEEPSYPAAKRRKCEEPFNLSMKQSDMSNSSSSTGSQYSNQAESNHNKAELARLSVQLGLNQPEVSAYPSTASTSARSVPMQQQALLGAVDDTNMFGKVLIPQAMLLPPPYPINYYPEASKTISMGTPIEERDMERLKEYAAGFNALPFHQRQYAQMVLNAMMIDNNSSRVPTSSALNISSTEAPQKITNRSRSVLSEVQPAQGISIGTYPATLGLAPKPESNRPKITAAKDIKLKPTATLEGMQREQDPRRNNPVSEEKNLGQDAPESLNGQGLPKNLNKRSRSVLSVVHNLCPENQNLSIDTTPKENAQEPFCVDEAIKNGEKFLDSLKNCSDPSISSSQVKPVIVLVKILREIFEKQNAAVLKPNKIKRK